MPFRSYSIRLAVLAALPVFAFLAFSTAPSPSVASAESIGVALPAPKLDTPARAGVESETAILAGGCFWGVQGVFQHVKGVRSVVAGYSGGAKSTAHYRMVGAGNTGHAESVEIRFDPRQISFGQILHIFFSVATDPTQVNQQYPDRGAQYRSEIFYNSADQQRVAQAYISQLDRSRAFPKPIATRVDPAKGFYPAEDYHQDFLLRHPDHPYIVAYDLPKIAALKRQFPDRYRATPITVAQR